MKRDDRSILTQYTTIYTCQVARRKKVPLSGHPYGNCTMNVDVSIINMRFSIATFGRGEVIRLQCYKASNISDDCNAKKLPLHFENSRASPKIQLLTKTQEVGH